MLQIQNTAKKLASSVIRNYVTVFEISSMSKHIVYNTIILQDSVFEEIQKLQDELSQSDKKKWSVSNVITLLLRFYFDEINDPIFAQKILFLKNYLTGKELFLNKFIANVLVSSVSYS